MSIVLIAKLTLLEYSQYKSHIFNILIWYIIL